jgi:hypothetical protein
MPTPKQTRQTVSRWFSPAADNTIRNTDTARGPPNLFNLIRCQSKKQKYIRTDRTKFVTIMKTAMSARSDILGEMGKDKPGPRFRRNFSFAASLALVEEAGYSPPTP